MKLDAVVDIDVAAVVVVVVADVVVAAIVAAFHDVVLAKY